MGPIQVKTAFIALASDDGSEVVVQYAFPDYLTRAEVLDKVAEATGYPEHLVYAKQWNELPALEYVE